MDQLFILVVIVFCLPAIQDAVERHFWKQEKRLTNTACFEVGLVARCVQPFFTWTSGFGKQSYEFSEVVVFSAAKEKKHGASEKTDAQCIRRRTR